MTRTTLKALWLGGGGLLATWLTVSPDTGSLPASRAQDQQTTAHSEQKAGQLIAEAVELRARTTAAMRPSTRNPFRFNSPKPEARPASAVRDVRLSEAAAAPVTPAVPPLSLAGIAQNAGARTAIITSGAQMYLVSEGETVAGQLTVVKVDSESVLLRDSSGTEMKLHLAR